ncbi:hypothetical protein D4A47_06755 [Anaerotruncus massiliensis (ex Liu et al. 2021)]|uniref:Uncharacterized protein n=2 Tax=Anaerotruncus TaxID=244127 RepID=A0A498CVF2_9FIRM|nr:MULTISPECIES: hypothetical protein [Anaerotruncus]MBC3938620.1 hypothetical protein [Anaerotruncus massiliensis (ex Togo et al. 2019)]RLL11597.1 hypothetical protein D4A47_06755 [Anaerotruncus massiliensis (ex Liu et al. 2021)]
MQAVFETLFDIVYLSTVITLGYRMIRGGKDQKQYLLFGIMAVVLGCGDAFHLIPRAVALCTTGLESYPAALGIGKLVTSITMTVFYLLLYYVWRARYRITGRAGLTAGVWALSLSRILLCLAPQNRWTSADAPLSWGIYRNIPFALLGLLIVLLFYRSARRHGDRAFRFLWLAVLLSFAFYLPVVLFADALPPVGMLMIPKTCVYVWMVVMGFRAMKGEH